MAVIKPKHYDDDAVDIAIDTAIHYQLVITVIV